MNDECISPRYDEVTKFLVDEERAFDVHPVDQPTFAAALKVELGLIANGKDRRQAYERLVAELHENGRYLYAQTYGEGGEAPEVDFSILPRVVHVG